MNKVSLPQMKQWATELDADEQRSLLEHLVLNLQGVGTGKSTQSLLGIWKGRVPEDFDFDAALHDVRREWEKEWTGDGEFVG